MLLPREVEILQLKSEGKSNAKIAKAISLSEPRVKDLLTIIYRKLGVNNGAGAVDKAQREGLIPGKKKEEHQSAEAVTLTSRESEVAALVAGGNSNKEIARRLGIGLAAVKGLVASVIAKFNCQNRVELTSVLLKQGIVK